MTYFLRFPNEQAWTAAAAEAGFYSEPDEDGSTTLLADGSREATDTQTRTYTTVNLRAEFRF